MKRMLAFCFLGVGCYFAGAGEKIVEAARKQIGVTVGYDPAYVCFLRISGRRIGWVISR
jgi:uncharacterized protein YijF (DUF1287 family)|tara:strand:+ start:5306 stop:5482 length:177 start_codon:yes stop_codon:yes gene_type:complete